MNDLDISLCKLVTLVLWTWTLGILILSWIALAAGHEELFEGFGFTACASSAVAATAQIRRYSLNVCETVQGVALVNESRSSVRSMR